MFYNHRGGEMTLKTFQYF